jgi:putative tryptophan/tyrosine transport system substrate-binding protein
MDRRRFLVTSLAGALAAPIAAEAQQAGRVWRIGVLQVGANTEAVNYTEAVRQGLREHGYREGQNIIIEHRISNDTSEHPAVVADLLRWKIDILLTWTTPALVAAKKATRTIPIVGISGDPVQTGLVESLARPGGNLTGLAILTDELELKNLQLLTEIAPRVKRVAVLWNPDNPVWLHTLKRLQETAPALSIKLQPLAVRDARDLGAAFTAGIREKADGLLVVRDATFNLLRRDIVNFAASHRLPAVYGGPYFVEVGGLLVYAANFLDMLRRAGGYVDKILKGAKPGDLPLEQAIKFDLIINLKTAKGLGLTIPPSLLAQADQVIE